MFGFDAILYPDGGGGKSLHELSLLGRKDEFSARKAACDSMLKSEPEFDVPLEEIEEWTGGYQSKM